MHLKYKNKLLKYKFYRFLDIIIHKKSVKKAIKFQLEKRLVYTPPTTRQINWCFRDYLKFNVKYRGSLEVDYFGDCLYRKSDFVRQESFGTFSRNFWRDQIQDKKYWNIFITKSIFYENFKEYINRCWLLTNNQTTLTEIKNFCKKCHNIIISKEDISFGGTSIKRWKITQEDELKKLYEYCHSKGNIILEQEIKQCREMHAFSKNTSVNTFRIVTIVDEDGNPHIAKACFRIGRENSVVDNFSNGGMTAPIDIKTGIIYGPARTSDEREIIIHPDSKLQIVGFKIPDWENYKKFALELAKKFPTMRYVGWDIVKDNKNRFTVIEGNKDAGPKCLENGLLYGLYPEFNKLLTNTNKK